MKTPFGLLLVFALGIVSGRAVAAATPAPVLPDDIAAAVAAADDERVAATTTRDRARLDRILSDQLRYGHSNGVVDTKSSLMNALIGGSSVYERFEYKERRFTPAGPGVVLMTGRVIVHLRAASQPVALDLNFLAVWRQENGQWRFLAWQSVHSPATAR